VADGLAEVANSFVYLGSMIDSAGGDPTKESSSTNLHELLEKKLIWKSSIRLDTKLRLYQTYVVPVLMYSCETWSTTQFLCARIDAFDM